MIGLALTSVEVTGAYEYLTSQQLPSYLIAGGCIAPVAAALIPVVAGFCWRNGSRLLAICLLAMMIPVMAFIVSAAIERTGAPKNHLAAQRHITAVAVANATKSAREAEDQLAIDKATLATDLYQGEGSAVGD